MLLLEPEFLEPPTDRLLADLQTLECKLSWTSIVSVRVVGVSGPLVSTIGAEMDAGAAVGGRWFVRSSHDRPGPQSSGFMTIPCRQ